MNKIALAIVVATIICIISGYTLFNKETTFMNKNKTIMEFTISDFTKVKIGMTYDEVVNLVGDPIGSVGSGIVWQRYNLTDGSYIKLLFFAGGPLSNMCIVDPAGRIYEIKQD